MATVGRTVAWLAVGCWAAVGTGACGSSAGSGNDAVVPVDAAREAVSDASTDGTGREDGAAESLSDRGRGDEPGDVPGLPDPGGPEGQMPGDRSGDALLPPPGNVLLLDLEMRHPVSWSVALEQLQSLGHGVVYRRWYPHLAVSDVVPDAGGSLPYPIIIVSAGNAPGEPSERLRPDDADRLVQFLENEGTLLVLVRHTWKDGYGGDSDWLFLNRTLEKAGVAIRIPKNTAIGFTNVPVSGKPPHHVMRDQSYPGSLEWTIDYPVGYSATDLPWLASAPKSFAAGVTSTLSCDGDELAAIAWTHKSVLVWEYLEQKPDAIKIPLAPQPLAVAGPTPAGGFVAVAPRSLLQLPVHTEYMSDKPILDLGLLDNTEAVAKLLLEVVSAVSRDRAAHVANGCHVAAADGMFSASGKGLAPLSTKATEVQAVFPPSTRAVAEALPVPPEGASLADEPAEAGAGVVPVLPSWYRDGRGHIGYGGVRPYEEMKAFFAKSVANGIDAFVVTVDPQWLADCADAVPEASPLAGLAAAAQETGANLFLGVNFLTAAYGSVKPEAGSATGAYGQVLEAPPPLSDVYWDAAMTPLFLGAARAAEAFPGILGLHLDMELYGAGQLWYSQGYAFDDDTWTRILAVVGQSAPGLQAEAGGLGLTDRLPWLVDHGLAGPAFAALEQETAQRVAALREEAWAIHPDLEMAFYGVMVSTAWFYKGWMRGLSTPERPVTHLSYDIATRRATQVLQREGIAVLGAGGILGVLFSPEDLAKGIFGAGSRADAYWLFQFTDFPVTWDPDKPPKMNGTPDAYWEAIAAANQQLDATPSPW